MKADAIIFDKDGTLIDFDAFWVPLSIKAIETVLKRLSLTGVPVEQILESFGVFDGVTSIDGVLCKGTYRQMGEIMLDTLRRYGYTGTCDEVVTLLAAAYGESIEAGQIKPTCPELAATLAELRNRNKHFAVVTTDNEEITCKCLKALGIYELFDKIYTDDGAFEAKPAPDAALDFMKRVGVPAERVLMVGDTMTDVTFARHAGISVIGVSANEKNRYLLSLHADGVISQISELLTVIEDGE